MFHLPGLAAVNTERAGTSSISRLTRFVLGHSPEVLILALAFIAAMLTFAIEVRFDSSIAQWFVESDPAVATYEEFLDSFQSDQLIVIGVFAPNVFEPAALRTIRDLTTEVESLPQIRNVRSILNTTVLRVEGDEVLLGPLAGEGLITELRAEQLRSQVLDQPLLTDNLVAEDLTGTALLVDANTAGQTMDAQVELVSLLEGITESYEGPELDVRLAGSPVLEDAFLRYSLRDFYLIIPLALAVALGFCISIFRHPVSAAAPVLLVALTGITVVGIMGAADLDANMLSAALVAIVAVAGIANPVHLVSAYTRFLRLGQAKNQALENAISQVRLPSMFSTATTVAGFLSLAISDLGPVREFSILASTGLVVAFIGTFTLVPAFLNLLPTPSVNEQAGDNDGLIGRLLQWISRPTRRACYLVLAVGLSLICLSAIESRNLEVTGDFTSYLASDDPVIEDVELIDAALHGSTTIEFFVKAPNEGFKDPEVLERLLVLQASLESRPGIVSTFSVATIVADIQLRVAGPDAPAIPQEADALDLYFDQLETQPIFADFLKDDLSTGRVQARVNFSDARVLQAQLPEIDRELAEQYNDDQLQIVMTGAVKLLGQMDVYLNDSLWQSFVIAFVAVSIMIAFLFRSLSLGALALLPNIAPILLGLGAMRLFDVPMDTGTVMVAAVAMGMVVDDTVHLLHALRHGLERGASVVDAMAQAVMTVGRPLLMTSAILAAGFLVLASSSFMPTVRFGTVSALVALLALIGDLTLLPAVVVLTQRFAVRGHVATPVPNTAQPRLANGRFVPDTEAQEVPMRPPSPAESRIHVSTGA